MPTWGVFPDKSLQGGGPLIDIGTHALDLTLWMMGNYDVQSVTGSVFYKLGNDPMAPQGNLFGPWDPDTYEVEDSAMGFIKMKNGSLINLEAKREIDRLRVELEKAHKFIDALSDVVSAVSLENRERILNGIREMARR